MRSRVASPIGLVIRPFPQVDVTSGCKSNGHFAGRMEMAAHIDRKPEWYRQMSDLRGPQRR